MWTLVKNLYLDKPLMILCIWENCVLLECHGASFSQWKIKPIQIHCSLNHPGYSSHRVICQHVLTVSKPNTFLWWNISHYEVTLLGKCSCKIATSFGKIFFKKQYFEGLNILLITMDTNLYVNRLYFWLVINKLTKVCKEREATTLKFVLFQNKYTSWLALNNI